MDEARALIEAGEPLVEAYPEHHAKFLCKKGQVYQLTGDAEVARTVLVQVQKIASELNTSDDGELGQAIAALVAVSEGTSG